MLKALTLNITAAMGLLALSAFVTPDPGFQGGIDNPNLQSKRCNYVPHGSGACVVKLLMEPDTSTEDLNDWCVTLTITCPAGVPPGDPGEECTSTPQCGLQSNGTTPVTIICDGQTFSVAPDVQNSKNWGDVSTDCVNALVSVS